MTIKNAKEARALQDKIHNDSAESLVLRILEWIDVSVRKKNGDHKCFSWEVTSLWDYNHCNEAVIALKALGFKVTLTVRNTSCVSRSQFIDIRF